MFHSSQDWVHTGEKIDNLYRINDSEHRARLVSTPGGPFGFLMPERSRATEHERRLTITAQSPAMPQTRTGQPENSAIVAIYDTHGEAEAAIRELQRSGFDMTKLSIVGKNYHSEEDVVGYYTAGDRMKTWGATGAFWGGIWSLLFGSAFFLIPGIGPLLAAGPIVAWIVGALEGAAVVGGVTALGAALFSIGIPNDSIIQYEAQIKAGKFVVIARDSQGQLDKAKAALEATQHQGMRLHAGRA